MNRKNVGLTLIIFLIIFISITTVSAEDIGVNDVNSTMGDNSTLLDEDVSSHTHTELSGVLSDYPVKAATITAPGGTFSQLQGIIDTASAGDTIEITGDYSYNSGFSTTQGVLINKKLTINGNDHVLDGKSNRIMQITASNVVVNGVYFKSGCATSSYVDGGWRGGGIAANGNAQYLLVNNCTFVDCYARTFGAAIQCWATYFTVNNSVFYNNSGGSFAVCTMGYNTIVNSIFVDNKASSAIYRGDGNTYVNNNVFVNNNGNVNKFPTNGDYNWYGSNTPTYNIGGTPNNFVILNVTSYGSISSGGGSITLKTSLNNVYNIAAGTIGPLVGTLPSRPVTYTSNFGTFNSSSHTFAVEDYVTLYYPPNCDNLEINVTVDNQKLTLTIPKLDLNIINITTSEPQIGDRVTFKINITNNGLYDISYPYGNDAVLVNFTVPYPLKYISSTDSNYNNNTGIWYVGNLNVGQTKSISLTLKIPYNQSLIGNTINLTAKLLGGRLLLQSPNNITDSTNITLYNKSSGSYTDLQDFIDSTPVGGTLDVPYNITFDPIGDAWLKDGMRLNKSISINGNGFTIDGLGQSRIFYNTATNVALANFTFINGYAISDLGAGYRGGAIFSIGVNFKVFNCLFTNNYARDHGSAVNQFKGSATYFNCTFVNNTVGTAYTLCVDTSGAVANVYHCLFENNTVVSPSAGHDGESLWLGSSGSVVSNSAFIGSNRQVRIQSSITFSIDNNWWGTNTPNFNILTNGIYPSTYVIMNFTNNTPITYSTSSSILQVNLNEIYNRTTGTYYPLNGTVPTRNVIYEWTKGTVSPSITTIDGVNTTTFNYPANMGLWTVNATIDSQTLWIGSSDIGIYITPSSNPIDDGSNITYIVTVVNNGPINATNVNVTLFLPSLGLNITNITNNTGYWNETTGEWYIGNLSVGQNATVIINGTLCDPGPYLVWNATIVNVTDYYDHNFTNNTFISNVTVNQISDLEIHKNLTENITPQAKDNITYMIVVFNNGPSTAVNVSVFDNLSNRLIYINSSATKGYYNETTGIWFLDNMTPYSNETLNITVNVNRSGFTDNFVNVTSNITDNNLTNNYDNYSFMTPPISDLWVTIDVEPQSSNYIVYHIQAGNNGIEDANGTVVVFNLSNLYFYFNHTADKGIYNNLTGVWDIGELNVNETVNMTLIVRLDFPTGTVFSNVTTSVNISSWSTDLYPENNTDKITFEAEIFGNFRLLQDIVDSWPENTTQILPRSFAYDPVLDAKWAGETYDLINGVRLYKNVTIVNPNGYTLGGFNMARIFNISANNVILDGLRFFDGDSPLGGALNIHSDNVQVLRSNFTHNRVFGDYGGAIFTSGKNTLIQDNLFVENDASKLGGAIGAAGATNIKILNNTFINNTVDSDSITGGAVGIANSTATVNGNVFLDNHAINHDLGHTIYLENGNVNLEANWYGNNTPDMENNTLIWGNKPNTYVILDWEIVNPNMTGVTLNTVFVLYNRITGDKTVIGYGLPYRIVNITSRDPTLSGYNTTFTGNNTVNYTYNIAIPVYQVNATVDYQTITLEWSTFLDAYKSLVNDTIWFGDDFIYLINLTNYGPHNSYIVTISDLLPENLTINSVLASYGSTSIIGDDVYWTISINAGTNATLIVNATPTSEGVYVNNLTVNSTSQYDYFWHGNSTNATGEVMPLADLSINITISNPPYYVGEDINYTVTIHNTGPSNATNVRAYIPIPTGLTFLYAWNLGGYVPNYTSSTGLWNVGILHVNETIEINMTLRLNSSNWYNQTVNITGHVIDLNNTNNNDTVSFNVTTQVDLELNMTINKNVTIAGDTNVKITYSLINKGPSSATNVSVFTVFSGLQYLSASGYGGFNNLTPFTGYWVVGNLSKNQWVTVTLTFNASSLGTFTVTGKANSSDNESYWSDNYDNVTINVREYADLSITKMVSNSTPFLLHNVTYTITVHNNGPYNAYNVTVYDLLPSVLIYNNTSSGFNGSEWFVGTLIPGESKNLSFNVTVDGIGDIWNNVTVNSSTPDSNYDNNHDGVVIHVPVADDLRIYLDVIPSTPSASTMFLINVSVWNYGYEDNNDVYVEFVIPSGLTWVSDTSGGAYNPSTGIWNIGVLGNGQRINMEIWVSPSVVGNVTLQANVTGQVADPAPWNNRVNLTFEIVPSFDLVINKTANTTSINDGDYVTFYITVSNKGPYTAKDIIITDSLPNGVIYLINNASGVYNNASRTINWTISSLGVGESRLIELRVRSWNPGTSFTNIVNVSAYGVDSNITDNTASCTVNVSQIVDLEVVLNASKVVDIDLGESITFYVTVFNHGPSNATGVIANFIVPNLFTLVSENSTGTYNNLTGDWFIGNLVSGGNISLKLVVKLNSTGKCVFNASVNGTYPDSNLTNNYDELNITATRLSDLNITAYWSNNTIYWYELSNLTIVVGNGGPDDAINVTVKISVPGFGFVNATGDFNETLMLWSVGNLSVGQYKNITMVFNGTYCGLWSSKGNVSSYGVDNDTGNNNFKLNITVLPVVDLVMTNLTVNSTFAGLDSILEFNVTVYNKGPCNVTNASILGLLPAGWIIYGGSTFADIPVNSSHTFNIFVNATSCGNFTVGFNVTVNGLDTNISNNWLYVGPVEVVYSADLMITIGVSDVYPIAGDIIVYVVTVSNLDWHEAHNVTANVTIPGNLTFDHYYCASGTYNPFNGTWTIGNMSFRNSTSLFLFARVNNPGNISFWVNVTGDDYDFNPGNNNDTCIINAGNGLDLNITIVVDNGTPYTGDSVTFMVVVENNGLINATGVSVDINIPVGLVNVTCGDLNFTGTSWYVGNLTGGSIKTLTFTATPILISNLTVNATVSGDKFDYIMGNNFANVSVVPIGVADLEVNITCNNSNPTVNETVTYTISVLNKGLVNVDTVLVYNNLPYSTVYSTSVPLYNPSLKLWTISNLTPNAIQTLNITINHTAIGIFNYIANITGNILELNITNNLANITVNVNDYSDLITFFTVSNGSVVDNGLLNFTISVYNNGTFNYTNVIVYTDLPETTSYNGTGVFDTNLGLWDVGNLTAGENKTLTLTINMVNVGNYTYWANATSKEGDRNYSNNNQSLNVTIYADYDVGVNITLNSNGTVNVGDNVAFVVTVWNRGPSTAYNVKVLNNIYGTLDSLSKGTYTSNNWTVGTLVSGETETLILNLATTGNGTFVYDVEATLDDVVFDRNITNNKDNVTVSVVSGVDLVITLWSNSTFVNRSDVVELIVSVYNNGSNVANNVLIDTSGLFDGVTGMSYSAGFVSGSQWFIPLITPYTIESLKITRVIFDDTLVLVNVSSDNVELDFGSNCANLTVNITRLADLVVTINVSDVDVIVGDNVTFTITIYNMGNDTAENVTVFLDLPYSTNYSDVYMYDSLHGIWDVGTLPNGANKTLNVTVTLNAPGLFTFNAKVNTTINDINLTNNVDNVTLNISNLVDLSINVSVNSTSLFAGDNVTFVVTVSNLGPGNASGVIVIVNLPGSLSYLSKGFYTSGIWSIGNLNKDEIVTLKLTHTLAMVDEGFYVLNVSGTDVDDNLTNNNAILNLSFNQVSDLEIQIKSSTNIVNATNPLNYTVFVFNHGINNVSGANVNFTLPDGFIISGNMSTNGVFGGDIWTLGTLNAGDNATLYIFGFYNSSGDKTVNVFVNSSNYDSNLTNNYANTSVFVVPRVDLYVNFTTTGYYNPDGTITFNISVFNYGPSLAENITLCTNLDLTSDYNATDGYFDTIQNIWYINALKVGESETLILNTTAIGGVQYYANVTSSTEELNKTNNIRYLNLTVTPLADLSINITANTTMLHVGDSVNFTVTVINLGLYNATGVNVYTTLPASPDYIVSKGLYDTLNGNWSIGNLSIGEIVTLNLILNITSTGEYVYGVNVTSSSNDTNLSNNNDTINLTVEKTADLSIKILTNTTSFIVGENITFVLNVTNYGWDNATNVTSYFILENFTITNITTITGTFDNKTWNITELTNDTSVELNITGFFITNGTKNIRANVSSLTYDNDTSNNYDTLSVSVVNPFDLEISIFANVTSIYAGDYVEFRINVTNYGPGVAGNILIETNIFNATSVKPNGYYDKDTGYIFINSLDVNSTFIINLTKQLTFNTTFTVNITNTDLNNTNNNDSIFINVSDCADLNLDVTVNTLNPYFDDDLTYTITVTNIGYSLAENVTVNTTLPITGFKFISANSTNYANGLWSVGNLNIGESATLTVNFKTNRSGLVNVEFNATTSTYESNIFNNYANLTVNVSNSYKPSDDLVDLIISIVANNTNPNINGTVLFNISVFNNASVDATNLTILSFLPAGLTPVGAYTGNWSVANLTAYGNVSFTFMVNVTSYGSFVTNTSVDCVELDRNAINNRANLLVVSSAPSTNYVDLIVNVTKMGNLTLGETFTYNITVTNLGSSTAHDVNCTISLFSGLVVVNQSSSDYNDTLSLWNVGNLTGGASKNLVLTINITNTGYYTNAFLVWSNENDAQPQNNLILDSFQVNDSRVDINVRITANKTYVTNNETILFTVTVTNPSLNTATDVNVTLDIPNEFTIINFVGNDTNTSYYIGNLTGGSIFNFTFTAKLNSTNASTVTVNVTLNETDYNLGNNVDSITILPLGTGTDGVADLHINITVNEQYPEIETVPIFNVWVTNFGPDNATNIEVPIYVPADCISTSADTYWDNSTSSFRLANLSAGSTIKFEVSFRISTTNPIIFNASASSDQFDPNITDNKASISLYPWEATPTCDLNITIVPIGSEFHANDTVKFNVTIRNFGEKTAFNVSVHNIVPPGLTLLNISATWAYTLTSDGWFMPNHTINTNKSFILTYKIDNKGLYQTTMEVNSSTLDVDPTSNGMGVAIYAGEAEPDRRNVTTKTTGTVAVATLNGNANWTFKGTLKMANTTASPTQNFPGQKLYANITSDSGFELLVESIDVTGTNGVVNFAVNSAQLMTGAHNYKVTIFYKGEKTSDTYYLPSVATSITRKVTVNP